MAFGKNSVTLFASQSVAPGLTKANAVFGAWQDVRAFARQTVRWKTTNGASAPGAAPIILIQMSTDNGATVYEEYETGVGDTVASSIKSGPLQTDDTCMYVRVGFYNHTTNAVTCESTLQGVTL